MDRRGRGATVWGRWRRPQVEGYQDIGDSSLQAGGWL